MDEEHISSTDSDGELPNKTFSGRSLTRRRVISVIVALILCGVIVAVVYKLSRPSVPLQQQVRLAQNRSQYTKAIKLLQGSINSSSSTTEKAGLYRQLGDDYLNNGNRHQAIQAYKQAAQLNGMTSDIADQLAHIYMQAGNKQQAIYYLKLAIKLWPKSDPVYSNEVSSLEQTIQNLGGDVSLQ